MKSSSETEHRYTSELFLSTLHCDGARETLPMRISVHVRDLFSSSATSKSNSSHSQRDRRLPV